MDLVSSNGKTKLPQNPFAESQGQDDDSVDSVDKIDASKTQTDRLVAGAFQVQKLFEGDDDQSMSSQTTTDSPPPIEELPLLSGVLNGEYDPTDENAILARRRKQKARRFIKMLHRKLRRLCRTGAQLISFVRQGIATAYFAFAAIPLVMTAWILFYNLGNPRFDFLPGTTTLSWWCNFFARQLLTLELARLTQFFLVDGLTLRTKFTITVGGPLVTLLVIQAKGWPFLLFAWSVIDLLILHGDDPFAVNWLYWTGLRIFSPGVSGAYLINSDVYFHALMCLVFSGVVTSLKRTFMAVYFGRKTLVDFKPRMEQLMKDIVLIAEVAELAERIENMVEENPQIFVSAESDDEDATDRTKIVKSKRIGRHSGIHSMKWKDEATSSTAPNEGGEGDIGLGASNQDKNEPIAGFIDMKDLLDAWEEPSNKRDKNKNEEATVQDVLQFRRALELMDIDRPFGQAFGSASNRNECIISSHTVYSRLIKMTPDNDVLPFETLNLLAVEEDEEEKQAKSAALLRLFCPDRHDNVTLLAFVQSCDSLYRRLRYFRASVGNASVIDNVLEAIFDGLFLFILFLVNLSILKFNPWPLLVSLSTLLVSFSFAVGASASKYIEGIFLIAIRRPFDLGDRIEISEVNHADNPGVLNSWFVEDINLYYTTLRFARTNEVCTVSNGTLSNSRIVNCNRSPGAIIIVEQDMHISLVSCLADFEHKIYRYADENPREWDAILFVRIDKMDSRAEKVLLKIGARHRNGWHSAGRILRERCALQMYIHTIGESMGVNYNGCGPSLSVVYKGGDLKDPCKSGFGKDLLAPDNVVSK
ncbi:hypothetical protein FisN_28Lh004 [Fistulifera solaris]|uniref:Mechanosensitive ion channel MscS domain-containing protein n=1 Tax=Fistulifera solaris TaxID=1519565 RepID=A0A1Z5KSU9_FISSO|nr:hypothetical protein FisN_28Lh004 [Fistulifera solaris]|eukprot:GAX29175.1 hypothetical protein FisN_28Lh004 [Fistulifera solaris]